MLLSSGAIWVLSGIPERWLAVLAQRERIEDLGRRLVAIEQTNEHTKCQPCGTALSYGEGAMSIDASPPQEMIAAWLREQGHHAEVEVCDERFSYVYFQARGRKFIINVDCSDPNFLYIVARAVLRDDIVDELLVLRAAGRAQTDAKVVKIGISWDDRSITFAAEQLVNTPGGTDVFWRTVALLDYTISVFYIMLDEEVGRVAAGHFTAQLEADLATKDTR